MGGISASKKSFIEMIGDHVGYKTGLALSKDEIISHMPKDYAILFNVGVKTIIHMRAEDYERVIASLLFRLGRISSEDTTNFVLILFAKYKASPEFIYAIVALYSAFVTTIPLMKNNVPMPDDLVNKGLGEIISIIGMKLQFYIQTSLSNKSYNERIALWLAMVKNKNCVVQISNELLEEIQKVQTDYVARAPWLNARIIEWENERPLRELFDSENLSSSHGEFFDQRFVDYLSVNSEKLKEMHWRQFEGFTAEYLKHEGYYVEIEKGRNDDGIDVRAWADQSQKKPTLIVQCKRQKEKIDKTVVKALWADIECEKAQRGLLVTTAELSPGSRHTIQSRQYQITECDYKTVQQWLLKMRTPWTGMFLPSMCD